MRFIWLLTVVLLVGCSDQTQKDWTRPFPQYRQQQVYEFHPPYRQDNRTGLCFAVIQGPNATGIATVPCSPEVMMLIRSDDGWN